MEVSDGSCREGDPDGTESGPAGQVVISGKLNEIRDLHSGGFVAVITMPAPDPYSHPATVEVMCRSRPGRQGDDVSVIARVGGWLRRFQYTDKQTGQQREGSRCELSLRELDF